MSYSLKLVNEALRLCQQERVGGISDPDDLPNRVRIVIDAYDTAYDAFLMDVRPREAWMRKAISPLAVTDVQAGDWKYDYRHALPVDALGLAEDPDCLEYEMGLDIVGGAERKVLRSNYGKELNLVYIRRVDPDALSPVAFTGASLSLAAKVAFQLTASYEITNGIRKEAREWVQRNIARKNQASSAKPKKISSMDRVRFGW